MASRTEQQLHTFTDVQSKADCLLDFMREKQETVERINHKYYSTKGDFELTSVPAEKERTEKLHREGARLGDCLRHDCEREYLVRENEMILASGLRIQQRSGIEGTALSSDNLLNNSVDP